MNVPTVRRAGLLAGPVLAAIAYAMLPETFASGAEAMVEFTPAGRATLALVAWMATWWMTEAVEIEITALLPITVFPLLGIASIARAAAPYAADVIFLFLDGVILGLAVERWGLGRRIAFFTLRLTGTRPAAMTGGFVPAACRRCEGGVGPESLGHRRDHGDRVVVHPAPVGRGGLIAPRRGRMDRKAYDQGAAISRFAPCVCRGR